MTDFPRAVATIRALAGAMKEASPMTHAPTLGDVIQTRFGGELTRGAHPRGGGLACINEAIAYWQGGEWTDDPRALDVPDWRSLNDAYQDSARRTAAMVKLAEAVLPVWRDPTRRQGWAERVVLLTGQRVLPVALRAAALPAALIAACERATTLPEAEAAAMRAAEAAAAARAAAAAAAARAAAEAAAEWTAAAEWAAAAAAEWAAAAAAAEWAAAAADDVLDLAVEAWIEAAKEG